MFVHLNKKQISPGSVSYFYTEIKNRLPEIPLFKSSIIMKNVGLLIAFAGGAIAGAVIGVMLAPEKGAETRKKIFDFAHDKSNEARERIKEYLEAHGIKLECCQLDQLVDELIDKDTPSTKDEF